MNRHGVAASAFATGLLLLPIAQGACPVATAEPMFAVPLDPPVDSVPPPCAAAFIAAVNGPAPETIAAFEGPFASAKRQGRATSEERLTRMRSLKEEFGRLTFRTTVSTAPSAIVVNVDSERAGAVELTFELSPDQPGKVDAIAIASGAAAERKPIDTAARNQIIDGALTALEEGYVFPDVAKSMAASVRAKRDAGAYDAIADDAALAVRLTADLQAVSKDKHLRVRIAPQESASPHDMGPSEEELRRENYGFKKIERLDGNIGYVRFDVFVPTDEAKEKASAAMQFVADCDAIIFDMRQNGGGSPEMIQYITSYLFDSRTHLNDMIDRDGKVVEEFWTLESVPGRRVPSATKVFVLTSGRTFSGAEEFTYNLKNLKRATIIGETTGGGAHPIRGERLGDRMMITVPFMRANNPITKTNWEGTGVAPDVQCPASEALDRALELARKP